MDWTLSLALSISHRNSLSSWYEACNSFLSSSNLFVDLELYINQYAESKEVFRRQSCTLHIGGCTGHTVRRHVILRYGLYMHRTNSLWKETHHFCFQRSSASNSCRDQSKWIWLSRRVFIWHRCFQVLGHCVNNLGCGFSSDQAWLVEALLKWILFYSLEKATLLPICRELYRR